MEDHKFPYKWLLSDCFPAKGIEHHKKTVFSCFSCGGGSTMGYKSAGYKVIGCNEIDPKMMKCYVNNFHPKYSFLESIQTFKLREDLPKELYNLDILDGSPPCSSFSMAGNREKDWGKEKKFREGQQKQVLDTLFFDFIDLAKKLQPKIVVAENVKGLLQGSTMTYQVNYVDRIYKEFDKAGYVCQHWLLDASKMGVPQKRERVFFIAMRKDLVSQFAVQKGFFDTVPKLELKFNEKPILFKEVDENKKSNIKINNSYLTLWHLCKPGNSFSTVHPKKHYFGETKMDRNIIPCTIIGNQSGSHLWHDIYPQPLTNNEYCKCGSFPLDYNFLNQKPKYLIGMSVPPVMMANIANQIYLQWLSKIKK